MLTKNEKWLEESTLQRYQERAEELGITLQEYLSFKILEHLDDLRATVYVEDV